MFKMIKILEETIREYLCNLGVHKKTLMIEGKKINWTSLKSKTSFKGIKQMKRQTMEWESIFTILLSARGLIF